MEPLRNRDKMLQAVLMNEELMKFGKYKPQDISTIYDAMQSDNYVVNAVAQIIAGTFNDSNESNIYKAVNEYLKRNV